MDIQALYPRLENINFIAKQVVEGFMSGLHQSPHHGYSVEFAEHRSYTPGDHLRYVDWKVYGRTEKMYVKKFEEETNVRSYFLLDRSSSMHYKGDGPWSKLEYGALLIASLAYLSQKQLDGVAWGYFSDKLESLSPVKSGASHLHQMMLSLEQVIQTDTTGVKTDLHQSLQNLKNRIPKRSLIYIFSDFLMNEEDMDDWVDTIQEWKYLQHEVVLVSLHDVKTEINLDFKSGNYTLADLESNARLDISVDQVREEYQEKIKEHLKKLEDFSLAHEIDFILFDTQSSPEEILRNYLMNRSKMR